MATSLPPVENVARFEMRGSEESRPQCLSSDIGSEVNDEFPTALALDAAAEGPKRENFPRSASRSVREMIRRHTSGFMPRGRGTAAGRENTKLSSTEAAAGAAAAAAAAEVAASTIETEAAANKAYGQRIAVPPASPRPSNSLNLRRKLSDLLGLGGTRTSSGSAVVLAWKPHEKISMMLSYRPRGHGRPFTDSYTLHEVLGRGGFGVVRQGTYKADGEVCAVKVIPREAVPAIDALAHEVDILRSLDHHQVMRFIDFYEEPQTYFLVLEKVPGGELFDRIISEGQFCEEDAVACIRSLLEALAYCHSRNIAHRDIKPENILFASLDVKDRTIKLADFGLARSVADGPLGGTTCGTPSYMAPESIKQLPHGTKVDCWGAGVVTHILLGGYAPFASSRTDKLFRLIKKGRVAFDDACWGSVTQRAKDFVLALLKVNPDTRLSAEQALRHPWLTEAGEGMDGGEHDLALSLSKLKIFSAKRKFRMAIQVMIACQRLHGWPSIAEGNSSTPAAAASAAAAVGESASAENRCWTFNPGTQTKRPGNLHRAPQRSTVIERRRFFTRERKGTGIFSEKDWKKSIVLRPSTKQSGVFPGGGALVPELTKIAAERKTEEENEDEVNDEEDDEELVSSLDEK